ncbi:ATP-utilizing chromatin assembly and remodelling N-terminal-domain-containing protein [Flammula alnicola]|nr:ATP-utilizing chromatin assembly and remodelling N-terminal-domain-containing protein [Flammula alnicola]
MPTCRRKRVVLTEPSDALLQAVQSDPSKLVFYLEQTGEIFETYEAYAARMSFYRLKQFQCEVTGKSGLDYFQAVESERQEARTLHSRFSEPLKPAVLKAVQWQVMGRLDHLVEAVYERFKDRYFPGERVLVDLSGVKYYARVEKVYPPKYNADAKARDAHMDASSSSTLDDDPPHVIGGDLKIPAKDAFAKDNPTLYYYWVHLTELERDKSHEKGKSSTKITDSDKRLVGSLIEVQCGMMSRDRLSFSKSILRRFIRDCVDREAAVASPWTVKAPIAKRYGVDSVMPEETRQGVENIKKGEIDKRKKIWEDKDGPPTKKQKKMTAAQEDRVRALATAAEKREREAREKADKQRLAKEEAERIAAEKKKKKPVRYPTEDLDIRMADKDRKAGMRVTRPLANRACLPFNDSSGSFEAFLMTWNFLVVYGQPLHLSVFSLDEFENALRHSVADQPCPLLAEVHSTLIYNLRTVSFVRHSALLSLLKQNEDWEKSSLPEVNVLGISTDQLVAAMADVGNNWERVPLRHSEGREGWEDALVGCLKDHANIPNFPRLQEILTKLLFAPSAPPEQASGSRAPTPPDNVESVLNSVSPPNDRYYSLPPEDRIAILSFMCNLAISSKAIHAHMESCEEQLTALRKEKIEVNRMKKQYQEEMGVLLGETKEENHSAANGNGEDIVMQDSSELSDVSEGGSESTSAAGKKSARQKDLRLKIHTIAHSKEREAARAKQASQKQAMAEHRRLDEEVNKLERRLESIEREFRKLLGAVRVKPIGRDRFYNRIWWFDGMGSASLVGSGGIALYGTGRLFIQGPSEFDVQQLAKKAAEDNEDIVARRKEEEGEEGMLGSQDWAVYTELEELEAFVSWLNPKGHRELALKTALTKWWVHITAGMRKRMADLNNNAKLPDARRSSRKTALGYDLSRDPYMLWTNRRAVNSS